MKGLWKDILPAVWIAWVIPWLLLSLWPEAVREPEIMSETESSQQAESPLPEITISVLHGNSLKEMPLSEYVTGVLLGELPGSFHMETKKAQAVAARTYTLWTIASGRKHPGCVCTDSGCCQAYREPADYIRSGGDAEVLRQARIAAEETKGEILTYNGEPIEATYFSSSGGYTEDAVAVWGTDVPYLQGVPSPEENTVGVDSSEKTFSVQKLSDLLGIKAVGKPENWFGNVTYTPGGGVDTISVFGKTFKGTQLRSLLGLRSTVFTVSVKGNDIIFTTKGHGHRVGMSQYGAQSMALLGSVYEEILSHYYPGTVLEVMESES